MVALLCPLKILRNISFFENWFKNYAIYLQSTTTIFKFPAGNICMIGICEAEGMLASGHLDSEIK